MRIFKRRGVIYFGVGGETVSMYDGQTNESYGVLHLKIEFWCWHLHFYIPSSRRRRLP